MQSTLVFLRFLTLGILGPRLLLEVLCFNGSEMGVVLFTSEAFLFAYK